MIVKPTHPGAVIRDPHTRQPLPDEGAVVPDISFWRRRLLDGDVEIVEPPKPAKPSKRAAKGPSA